nr:MAG TPA: hypothetical protein [Bacteriophage sp.]
MRNYHSIKYDLAVALCDRLSMKTVWLVKVSTKTIKILI